MPIKRLYGTFGFNITGSGSFLRLKKNKYIFQCGLIGGNVHFAYILPIVRRKVNFDIHIGGGVMLAVPRFIYPETSSDKDFYWDPSFSVGTGFQFYVHKKLYVELNFDHIVPFREGLPKYVPQLSLSIGWEF